MSQSFTIKRVRHTGASVYIGEVDARDTWTRNPEAIVNWLCDGWRTRFNQLRSCRQKTVWVDGVEARHPDGTKVLAPLGETVTDITAKQAREQFPHLAGLPSLVLESPTRIENTEWWTAVKRRRALANKGVPAGAMPQFKSRKTEQRFVMWFNNGKGYEVHRTGKKSGVVVVRGMVPKEHLRPGETSRYWRLTIHFRMSAGALPSTSMQVDWMRKRLTLVSPVPERKAPLTGAMVGLDVGVAHAVTTSDGTHLDLPDTSTILAKRKMHQRAMARSKARAEAEGREFWRSRRYREHKRLAAKHAQHLANVRREFAHQTSNALVRDHDLIVMEKLRVQDMTRRGRGKRGLNRSILESAWSMTRSMIEYKAGVTPGKTVVLVDPRHTSQRCRECGHITPENRESQAVFECTSCGHMAHADINAAGNILDRHLLGWTSPAARGRKTKKSEAPMASLSDLRTPALAPWGAIRNPPPSGGGGSQPTAPDRGGNENPMCYQLTPTDIQRIDRAMSQVDSDPDNWPTGEMVEAIAEATIAGIRTDIQPDDAVFNAGTMKVLGNMGERMLSTIHPTPQPEETPEQWQARSKAFDANLGEMARSLGTVLKYLSTPHIRLWPDNGREDCVSLSGSLHQMSFGIIFHANADGTGRWTFHS